MSSLSAKDEFLLSLQNKSRLDNLAFKTQDLLIRGGFPPSSSLSCNKDHSTSERKHQYEPQQLTGALAAENRARASLTTVFHAAALLLTPVLYDEIVEERVVQNICGFPVCSHLLPKHKSKKKYRIDRKNKKVYDISEAYNYCDEKCLRESKIYKHSLSDAPFYMREIEPKHILSVFGPAMKLSRRNNARQTPGSAKNPKTSKNNVEEKSIPKTVRPTPPSQSSRSDVSSGRQNSSSNSNSRKAPSNKPEENTSSSNLQNDLQSLEHQLKHLFVTEQYTECSKLQAKINHIRTQIQSGNDSNSPAKNSQTKQDFKRESVTNNIGDPSDRTWKKQKQTNRNVGTVRPSEGIKIIERNPPAPSSTFSSNAMLIEGYANKSSVKPPSRPPVRPSQPTKRKPARRRRATDKPRPHTKLLPESSPIIIGGPQPPEKRKTIEKPKRRMLTSVKENFREASAVSTENMTAEELLEHIHKVAESEKVKLNDETKSETPDIPDIPDIPDKPEPMSSVSEDAFSLFDSDDEKNEDMNHASMLTPAALILRYILSWSSDVTTYFCSKSDKYEKWKRKLCVDDDTRRKQHILCEYISRGMPTVLSELGLGLSLRQINPHIAYLVETFQLAESIPALSDPNWTLVAVICLRLISVRVSVIDDELPIYEDEILINFLKKLKFSTDHLKLIVDSVLY